MSLVKVDVVDACEPVVDAAVVVPALVFPVALDADEAPVVDVADNRLKRSLTTLLTSLCKVAAGLVVDPLAAAAPLSALTDPSPSVSWPVSACPDACNWVRSD